MRKYTNASASDLAALAKNSWQDAETLQDILHELAHRKSKLAARLMETVQKRILELTNTSKKSYENDRSTNYQDKISALFKSVGLAPECPDFLIKVARTAFRKEYHPDRFTTSEEKERASESFKKFENIFDEIVRQRAR